MKKFKVFYSYCGQIGEEEISPDKIDMLVETYSGLRLNCLQWMENAGAGDTFTTKQSVVVCTKGRRKKSVESTTSF